MVRGIVMESIEERANLAAWQIFEEIGLSKHSVDRVSEIIEEKIREQKYIDVMRVRQFLERESAYNDSMTCIDELLIEELCKTMEE